MVIGRLEEAHKRDGGGYNHSLVEEFKNTHRNDIYREKLFEIKMKLIS